MLVGNVWKRLSNFETSTDYFWYSVASFKLLGYSVWQQSLRYRLYQSVVMSSLVALWIFIVWDIWNNFGIGNVHLLTENLSTSAVHLTGFIRFCLFVSGFMLKKS